VTYYVGQLVHIVDEPGIWRIYKIIPNGYSPRAPLFRLRHHSGPVSEFCGHMADAQGRFSALPEEIRPLTPIEQLAGQAE
jgi:hypothetical protein